MGKSRFEGMEIAVREQQKISEANAGDKVDIETLEAELNDIDIDTQHRIAEIKATPIDKELLKRKAEMEMDFALKENDRICKTIILEAEQKIAQAELDADNEYKQAKLDIEKARGSLSNVKETAIERKKMLDMKAKEQFDTVLASIDNTEKTLSLQISKEEMNGEKRKKEIAIRLRALKARNKVVEDNRKIWEKLYNDTVEISKQPQVIEH